MGSPVQQPVYYDSEQGQYYTMNNQQNANSPNGAGSLFGNMFGNFVSRSGMPNSQNPFYAQEYANRNYLGNPYSSTFANRFTPKNIPTQYPEMDMLFPALNAGLASGIISSTQPDGAMLGAGRFIAPQTTSESKGK